MPSIKKMSILAVVLLGSVVSAIPVVGTGLGARAAEAATPSGEEIFSVIAAPTDKCLSSLYHVNVHRLNHSAPLITYNRTLETQVEQYVTQCGAYNGFPNGVQVTVAGNGTNDYRGASLIAGFLSSNWYDSYHIEQYRALTDNYTHPPSSLENLDQNTFTRLVWKGQQSMGCFAVSCEENTAFVRQQQTYNPYVTYAWNTICAFYPGGNDLDADAFAENVSGPLGLPTDNPDENINYNTVC